MKFEKKAVIFDLDGVICFTDKFHYQAWKALADRLGIYFDEKINNRLRGVSRMASLDIILERATQEYTQEEKEAFAEENNNTAQEHEPRRFDRRGAGHPERAAPPRL